MIRVITIGREFGSGGAEVAGILAGLLGWSAASLTKRHRGLEAAARVIACAAGLEARHA